MSIIASIFQYIGLLLTVFMAVISLFFKFTTAETSDFNTKLGWSRLTKAGRLALIVILAGGVVSAISAIIKDIDDSKQRADADERYNTLSAEEQIASEMFQSVVVKFKFDQAIDWRDKAFLASGDHETIDGSLSKEGIQDGVPSASWSISRQQDDLITQKSIEVLYVENRSSILKDFMQQNAPSSKFFPTELSFFGGLDDLKGYKAPDQLFIGSETNNIAYSVNFDVPDPHAQLKYHNDKDPAEMSFSLSTNMSYTQLSNCKLQINFGMRTQAVKQLIGENSYHKKPISEPYITQHLTSVSVLIDNRLFKIIKYRKEDISNRFSYSSEYAFDHNNLSVSLVNLTFDRQSLISYYKSKP